MHEKGKITEARVEEEEKRNSKEEKDLRGFSKFRSKCIELKSV